MGLRPRVGLALLLDRKSGDIASDENWKEKVLLLEGEGVDLGDAGDRAGRSIPTRTARGVIFAGEADGLS